MEKRCNVCLETKLIDEFYVNSRTPDGHGYTCKPCSRKRSRRWNEENRERFQENQRRSWANRADAINEARRERNATDDAYHVRRAEERRRSYERHREEDLARSKAWRESEAGQAWRVEYLERSAQRRRAVTMKRKYGLDPDEYDALLAAQNGVCAICGRDEPLTVDHDHACCDSDRSCGDCIRGLLCNPCNRALGFFSDDLKRVQAAGRYLKRGRVRTS